MTAMQVRASEAERAVTFQGQGERKPRGHHSKTNVFTRKPTAAAAFRRADAGARSRGSSAP
jgi:hypothetical protein